ncbi:MAG: antitoxin Xre/MbcA/ParS toxin-binding domain-containing protein [Steroidobacteraceae bacterium]
MTAEGLLGGSIPESDPMRLMEALRTGLPTGSLRHFKQATGLADEEIAELLQVGARTLTRLKSLRRLPADVSDRLYAVASIYALAEHVLGDRDAAVGWLGAPQFGLQYRRPRDFLSTELGRQQVKSLLNQIEYGMLA